MNQPIARPDPVGVRNGQVVFSRAARTVIVQACRRERRQAVVLSWPGGAAYLPSECFRPGQFDVVVGHIAGCPVYADLRRLELFRDLRVLLDAERRSPARPRPALRARVIESPSQTGAENVAPRRDSAFERTEAGVAASS